MESDQRARLEEWSRLIEVRHDTLHSWGSDLPEFWNVLAEHRVGVGSGTQGFVHEVVRRAVNDPVGFPDDPVIRTYIRDREIRLKDRRARLAHRAALENWNRKPVGGQLDYRWPVTKSYLADIAAAGLHA